MINLDYLEKSNESNYIKAIDVEYKAKDGRFTYFNWTERVNLANIQGIIVWSWFQFRGTLWSVSKKKGTTYLSEDFLINKDNKRLIHVHKFIRDGENRSNESMGDKTYAEWKEEGLRPCRVVFMVKPENLDEIYKVCLPPVASVSVSKDLKADAPNYISDIYVKDEVFETDNGDFLVPWIKVVSEIEPELEEAVVALVKKIGNQLSKKAPVQMPIEVAAEEIF